MAKGTSRCRAPKRKEVSLDEKKLKGNLVAKQGRA